ncbi:MAG: hypothetical protein LC667_07285, partial [Thioalkalivibrio sp.]|nr:hypothetical protein [Thioalkalivibrio sp.]
LLLLATVAVASAQSHANYAPALIEEVWGQIIDCDDRPLIMGAFDFEFSQSTCAVIGDTSTTVNKSWIAELAPELGLQPLEDGWIPGGVYDGRGIPTWFLLATLGQREIVIGLYVLHDSGETLMLVSEL